MDCAHRHCAICLEDSGDAGPPWSELRPCAHAFHGPCLRRWLEVQNTCPVCRVAVTELDGSPVAEARLRVEAEEYAPYGDVICQAREWLGMATRSSRGVMLQQIGSRLLFPRSAMAATTRVFSSSAMGATGASTPTASRWATSLRGSGSGEPCAGLGSDWVHPIPAALGQHPARARSPACAREMARRGLRPDDVDPCAAELAVLELLDFDAALIASYLAEGAAGVRAGRGARRGRRRQQRAESDGESGSGSGEEEGSVEVQVVGEVRGGRGGARDARTKGSVQAGGGEAVGDVTSGGRGKRGLGEKRGRGDEGSHGLRERPRKRVLRTGRVARPPRPWWATGADGAAVGRRARDC